MNLSFVSGFYMWEKSLNRENKRYCLTWEISNGKLKITFSLIMIALRDLKNCWLSLDSFYRSLSNKPLCFSLTPPPEPLSCWSFKTLCSLIAAQKATWNTSTVLTAQNSSLLQNVNECVIYFAFAFYAWYCVLV